MPFRNADEWGEMLVAESDTVRILIPRSKGELIPGRFAELSISAPAGARLRLLVPAACQCFDVLRHALTWICSILKDLNKSVLSCFVRRSVMCQIHLIHTSRFEGIEQIQAFHNQDGRANRRIPYAKSGTRVVLKHRQVMIHPQLQKGCGSFALQQRDTYYMECLWARWNRTKSIRRDRTFWLFGLYRSRGKAELVPEEMITKEPDLICIPSSVVSVLIRNSGLWIMFIPDLFEGKIRWNSLVWWGK